MKRNNFITALSALTVAPSVLFSRNYSRLNRPGKGFKVEKGKDHGIVVASTGSRQIDWESFFQIIRIISACNLSY